MACSGAAIHTHGYADDHMQHNTRQLDETNTAIELQGSAVTSSGTLGTSNITTVLSRAFPKEESLPHGCQLMRIVKQGSSTFSTL